MVEEEEIMLMFLLVMFLREPGPCWERRERWRRKRVSPRRWWWGW